MAPRLATFVVCVALVIAGCAGGATTEAPPQSGGGDGGGSDGGGDGPVWSAYEFRTGEYFEYEVVESGERRGTFFWEVESASADSVTIRAGGDLDGEQFEQTVTGPPDTVYSDLVTTPAGSVVFVAFYGPFVGPFRGEALSVGQSWSYTSGNETLAYAIERTETVAGREAFVSTVRFNGQLEYESWVDPSLAFAVKTVIYTDGEPDLTVTLVEYRG
jgi:hypothetical protein